MNSRTVPQDFASEARMELVCRSIPAAMAYTFLLVVIAIFTPYAVDHPFILEASIVVFAVVGVVRILLARRIQERAVNQPNWGSRAFYVGVLGSGAIWSIFSAFTISQYGEQWTGMVVLLMTAGIAAGGMTSLTPDFALTRAYLTVLLFPQVLASAGEGGAQGYAVASTIGIFAAFLFYESKHQSDGYWRAITDRAALRIKAAELEEAKRLADSATQAKSNFLTNMSHEIRTPMNAVLGMTELLLDSPLDTQTERSVRTIKESSESLLTIINDILDLSKIEAGKFELEEVDFSLRDTVQDVLRNLALRAHSKGLELSGRIDPSVPDGLRGDGGRLRQILTNLVGNAIKFTTNGGVTVEIVLDDRRDGSASLRFYVKDTGVGIPEEKQHLIFSAFTQADNSTTREFGGTGLGLNISRTLVEMMKGKIGFESTPGVGSTFHFTARFVLSQTQTAHMPAIGLNSLNGLNVLVVDDYPESCRILGDIFKRWRMQPVVAENAKDALNALETATREGTFFDFILIDSELRDEDGFSLAERLIKESEFTLPIMMLTSVGHRRDAARCQELGMRVFLLKPISESDLFDAMMTARGYRAASDGDLVPIARHFRRHNGRKLRILLAEDNAVNQIVAQEMLERRGHSVVVASNGRIALEWLQRSPSFDVILMDIQMPELDGFQTTAAIREMEDMGFRHIPIVAMTAHAMKGDRERCLAAGMDGYVSKPVRSKELYAALDAAVTGTAEVAAEIEEAESQVFDYSSVVSRLGGNANLLRDIVNLFNQDCPRQIAAIREAIAAGDCKALALSAHTLKGSLLILSADQATVAAQRLEMLGRNGNLTHAADNLKILETEVTRLSVDLQNMIRKLPVN